MIMPQLDRSADKNVILSSGDKIYAFYRHGESTANAGLATHRTEDVALTLKGLAQAEKIAENLSEHNPPDLIVLSPYKRARDTAAPTCKKFKDTPSEVWEIAKEFNYLGSVNDCFSTRNERAKKRNEFWSDYDPRKQDGQAETFEQFIIRARMLLSILESRPEKYICIFTHEQLIIAIQCLITKQIKEHCSSDCMKRFHTCISKASAVGNGERIEVQRGQNYGLRLDNYSSIAPVLLGSFKQLLLENYWAKQLLLNNYWISYKVRLSTVIINREASPVLATAPLAPQKISLPKIFTSLQDKPVLTLCDDQLFAKNAQLGQLCTNIHRTVVNFWNASDEYATVQIMLLRLQIYMAILLFSAQLDSPESLPTSPSLQSTYVTSYNWQLPDIASNVDRFTRFLLFNREGAMRAQTALLLENCLNIFKPSTYPSRGLVKFARGCQIVALMVYIYVAFLSNSLAHSFRSNRRIVWVQGKNAELIPYGVASIQDKLMLKSLTSAFLTSLSQYLETLVAYARLDHLF